MTKFLEFIDNHSPKLVSRHLRAILLDYIAHQLKTGLPEDFHEWLWELYDLLDLLDLAADQQIGNLKASQLQQDVDKAIT